MDKMNEILDLIRTNNNEKLKELIREEPYVLGLKTDAGISLLQFAAYSRNGAAIEILKKYKKDIDIFEAASIGDIQIVVALVDGKSELINSFSSDGFTVLGLASFFGHIEIVKLLVAEGANPNLASNNQFKVSPIHSACAVSSYDIASILIENGADVNARQMRGVTPLHSAAHNGQTILAKLLIDNGADVNAENDDGQTPEHMAEEGGFYETAELIKRSGGQ
jgi:ankyrin repeat protein